MFALTAALVLLGAPCGLILPDAHVTEATGHVVITSFDRRGNGIVVCHGQVDPPGETLHLDWASVGCTCGAGLNGTTDWSEVITADGRVSLVCRIVGN